MDRTPDAGARPAELFIARLIEQRLASSTESHATDAAWHPAWLTWTIITALVAMFVLELKFGIGQPAGSLEPTVWTLHAFGGTSRELVRNNSEWYRLFSATLLHGSLLHLAMNCIALYIAGRFLEPVIGSAWFGATYALGAVGGSTLSVVLNPTTLISVGASGAILALFSMMLIMSFRFPPGERRTEMRKCSIYTLVLSNLPVTFAFWGERIDYAGHLGGAVAGVLIGLVLLRFWPRTDAHPRLGQAAAALAVLGLVGFISPAWPLASQYPSWALAPGLMPDAELPRTASEIESRAAELVARYPRDPRARRLHAKVLLRTGDKAGAERELRLALSEVERWERFVPPNVSGAVRTWLAYVLLEDRPDEAKAIAQPVCDGHGLPEDRKYLEDAKLCAR